MYYLVIRPIHRDNELDNCLMDAQVIIKSSLVRKQAIENCFKQY